MYIWVILATFLVALYSFNLTYRSDLRSIEVEPVARALISKLVIKQQAAGRYMRGNTPPFAHTVDGEGNTIASDTITYAPGIITTELLRPSEGVTYLPYGFNDDNTVTSEVYCIDKDNHKQAMDCNEQNAIRYLVTYMPIPQRWLNVKTGLPNNDLNAAMKELIGYDSGFGYPVCKKYVEDTATGTKKCEQLVIRSREGVYMSGFDDDENTEITDQFIYEIPYYIAKNGGFADTCNNESNKQLCLMYIYEYKAKYYN